jgi:hypothetical protein
LPPRSAKVSGHANEHGISANTRFDVCIVKDDPGFDLAAFIDCLFTTWATGDMGDPASDKPPEHLNVALPFAPFEELNANRKRIYQGNPEFLNVFYITSDNKVRVKSHLNFPSGIDQGRLFAIGENHTLTIMVMAPNCEADTIELSFNWTGDINTAEVWASNSGMPLS